MRRRLVGIAAAAALVVSMVVESTSTASAGGSGGAGGKGHDHDAPSGVGSVTWGPCEDPFLDQFGIECGMLSVPLDYDHPRGQKIQLALSRLRHTVPDANYQGIMLVNPGGPGGSGLIYSVFGLIIDPAAGGAYDWIGFDPRGVGSSVPALSCVPDYSAGPRPPYTPATRDIERAWLGRVGDYAKACGRAGGSLLRHVTTIDNAKDMNSIRQALGQSQINFYGFSYGTYLGQVFATLYPTKVRRMVLDSNVDPRRVWYDANIDQNYAFETVIQLFFDWVASHDDVYGLGATNDEVEANYYAALDSLTASPQGILGPAELSDGFLLAGYLQDAWPDVADAFAALVNGGDPGPATDLFLGFVDTEYDNDYAMYLATECTDTHWPQSWTFWRRDSNRVAADAPFLTWGNTWFNAPCREWRARPGRPVDIKGKNAPPVLLLGETLDAATPFNGSLEVRRRFPKSVLIATDGGTTHANSLAGNPCVDDPIVAYLAAGVLPARVRGGGPDVVCTPPPLPEPAAADEAQARVAVSTVDLRQILRTASFVR